MRFMEDDPRRHGLRTGFDRAPEDYQRTRPVCPPQLFDDLIDLAGLEAGDRVIEIGCGTGQATVPLAERGLAVTAVELGAELGAIARRRLAGFPAAEVVTCSFEDWQPQGAPFDAAVAVNSLHWIDPPLRYAKPYELLRSGGVIAEAGCLRAQPADAERFWTDVQEDYRAVGFEGSPPPPPEQIGLWHLPPEAGSLFEEVASLRYPFQVPYSSEGYLANLATQSSTHALGEARSAEFLARVRHRLDSLGWPQLTATFIGYLVVGRRRRQHAGLESERFRHPPGQIILGHRVVDCDDAQPELLSFLAEAFREHPISFEQVVQGALRISGLPGDLPQRAPAVEGGPAEVGRREKPHGVIRHSEEWLHEAWQQPEALDDHAPFPRETEEVFDDQAKALAPKPVERLQHGLRGSVQPSLVHVHGRELGQERAVLGCAPAGVIRHHIVGRIQMQAMPSRYATSGGRLARTAPATDPVDMPELCTQRCGVSMSFRSHAPGPRGTTTGQPRRRNRQRQ
jgi:SAM-dependent methyltransferase